MLAVLLSTEIKEAIADKKDRRGSIITDSWRWKPSSSIRVFMPLHNASFNPKSAAAAMNCSNAVSIVRLL